MLKEALPALTLEVWTRALFQILKQLRSGGIHISIMIEKKKTLVHNLDQADS